MSGILAQIAVVIGGILFIVVMVVALAAGVPILEAVFRASVVMCATSLIMAAFFKFFTSMLYRFVAEQILQQQKSKQGDATPRLTAQTEDAIGR